MRIGLNGYYLSTLYSGIGQYSFNLISALAEIDRENSYYIFTQHPIEKKLPANFKTIIIKPFPFFRNTFLNRFIWEEFQLGKALKKHKIEVFHGLYQSLPRGSDKIANVVTIHDAVPWRFSSERKQFSYRWYSDIRRTLVKKRAKKTISISETSKLDFSSIYGIKPEEIEVTYQSVDPIFWEKPSKNDEDELKNKYNINKEFVLYTGGLKRRKNLRILIKSFDILIKDYNFPGDLYVLGAIRNNMAISTPTYYTVEDLQKYARSKKILDRIKFVGFVSQREMSTFMHLSSCFVSVSLYEGFGLPALEALTSGTPAVISNLGAYPEIAENAVLFVYPYGPHRIAKAINQVLTDKKTRSQLITNGVKRAKFFDRIRISKRVLEVYKEVYNDYKIYNKS